MDLENKAIRQGQMQQEVKSDGRPLFIYGVIKTASVHCKYLNDEIKRE
jgi:hypothetical protein